MSSMTDARDGCPKRSILRAQPKWKQPSIGSSVFLQRNFKDGPVADDNPWRPGRQFAMVCKTLARLRLRLLPPLKPSLGATELRSKSPDFLLLGRGPRKGETAIAKLLVSTAHGAGQDGQDGQENVARRHRPPSAARPPPPGRSLFVPPPLHGGGERDAAHRFGPKLWENVLLLSAKLGFSRCQPAALTPPRPLV